MDWNIRGHQKQITFLQSALAKGKLAHAYVFAGPEGVGKKSVALRLAKQLLLDTPPLIPPYEGEGDKDSQFFHPDLSIISSDNGIKIEQIRELIYKLSLKPYQAKFKVAIIDTADEMTTEAANSLLKSLEEPKSYTYIILITSNPNKLPRTISSRSQKITLGPVEFAEYENLLPSNLSNEKRELIKTIAGGKPGLALKIASDKEFLEQLEQWQTHYQTFNSSDLVAKLISAYEIADLETAELKKMFEVWLSNLQFELKQSPTKLMAQKINAVSLAGKYLDQNVNNKLLLTNLMLSV